MLKRLQIILQSFIMALFVIFVAFSNESKTGTWVFTSINVNSVQKSPLKEP